MTRHRALFNKLAPVVGLLIGLAGIAFVIRTLISKWDEVVDTFSQVEIPTLLVSLLLGLGAMTSIGAAWVSMLQHRGHHIRHREAMSWYFTGQLGKYVPGGIWPIVGRGELAARSGIPRIDAYASTGLSLVTTYLGAVVTIALAGLFTGDHLVLSALVLLGLVSSYVIFSNGQLRRAALGVVTKLSPTAQALTDPNRLVRLSIMHVPAWVLMSLSTSVTASAFGIDIGLIDMLFITSASWFIGFVVIGVPGGIGVREAVFTSLATGVIGAPAAVSLALMSRLVFIAVDVVGAAVSSLLARSAKSRKTIA
jgi:glycosyltransferase 2 family protein